MYRRLGFAKSLGTRPGMTAEGAEVPDTRNHPSLSVCPRPVKSMPK